LNELVNNGLANRIERAMSHQAEMTNIFFKINQIPKSKIKGLISLNNIYCFEKIDKLL